MTEAEIVEKVARAIFDDAFGRDAWDNTFYAEERAGCLASAPKIIAAHKAALEEAGYVVVPRKPSDAMLDHAGEMIAREYSESDWEEAKDMAESLNPRPIWDSMIAAAPKDQP